MSEANHVKVGGSTARLRPVAQAVVVGSAALNGVVWLYTLIADPTDTTRTIQQFLGAVTVVGGVCMGLLYVLHRRNSRGSVSR
jgi:hypothetical protein